jgi:hypothetical protein
MRIEKKKKKTSKDSPSENGYRNLTSVIRRMWNGLPNRNDENLKNKNNNNNNNNNNNKNLKRLTVWKRLSKLNERY